MSDKESSAVSEKRIETPVLEPAEHAELSYSPRSLAVQKAVLANAVGQFSSQDFAEALRSQDTASEDSDWEYEVEHYDQVGQAIDICAAVVFCAFLCRVTLASIVCVCRSA